MSTSLQISNGDNFTPEDTKLIPPEQECGGFKVDLLAGNPPKKEESESDSESSTEEEDDDDTSDDERKIADNPVLKERLRHLDKYASTFRYDSELPQQDPGKPHLKLDFVLSRHVWL